MSAAVCSALPRLPVLPCAAAARPIGRQSSAALGLAGPTQRLDVGTGMGSAVLCASQMQLAGLAHNCAGALANCLLLDCHCCRAAVNVRTASSGRPSSSMSAILVASTAGRACQAASWMAWTKQGNKGARQGRRTVSEECRAQLGRQHFGPVTDPAERCSDCNSATARTDKCCSACCAKPADAAS